MRIRKWVIGTGVGLLVVFGLVAALGYAWLSSYVGSDAFRHELEERASRSIQGTVTIQAISLTSLGAVELRGVTVTNARIPRLSLARIDCTYALRDLLSQRLNVTGLTLDQASLTAERDIIAGATLQFALAPGGTPLPAPTNPLPPTAAPTPGTLPFDFAVRQVKLRRSSIQIVDHKRQPVVTLEGIEARIGPTGGEVAIDSIQVPGELRLTSFTTPFTFENRLIEARPFAAQAFSGRLAGSFRLPNERPSLLELNARALNVDELLTAFRPGSERHLSGSLDLQSRWRDADLGAREGEGTATLTGGRLEGIRALEEAARLLKIEELGAPPIRRATTHFVTSQNVTRLTGLEIESDAFRITGDGTVGPGEALAGNLVLLLNRTTLQRLPKELAASFIAQPDGTGSIAFQVSGTLSNPGTDLPARLLLQNTQLQDLIQKQLNRFLHSH